MPKGKKYCNINPQTYTCYKKLNNINIIEYYCVHLFLDIILFSPSSDDFYIHALILKFVCT